MQEAMKFISDCGVFFLATAEGDQPRVRPMGFLMEWNGKLAMCTNCQKDMSRQMKANAKVELCACNQDRVTLRICGTVAYTSDRAAKEKALEVMPALAGMYSADDGIFEIFYLENAVATYQTMTGEKRTVKL